MSISIFFSVDDFYTPWIPRGRDNTRLSPELADRTGTPDKLEVFACTKSSEDPGNGTLVAQPRLTVNAISSGTVEWTGMNELVRFRMKNGATSPASGDLILVRVLPPIWFDAVDAS
jgi:hypothetical protein